jgi:hypothetical protein
MMSSKDFGEDSAFILYLAPVVVAIIYGAVVWAQTAKSSTMPPTAYLIVSKSPYLFLGALIAVCLAIIFEVRSVNVPERTGIVQANTTRLQILAIIVLVVSFLAAISAGGYNLTAAFSLFLNGRYALIYAFFLIGISLLLSPKQVLGNLKISSIPDILGLILLVVAPVLFYLGLKVHLDFTASAVGSLIVGIIGLVLLLMRTTIMGTRKTPQQVSPAKQTVSSDVIASKPPRE